MHIPAENKPQLRAWLVRTLEPICDADPGALADYVSALLERDAPEADLRKELTTQLDEFLEKDGPMFINTLFTVLRTKSYIPYAAAEPTATADPAPTFADEGIPIPFDAAIPPMSETTSPSGAGRKRGLDDGDFSYPPAKGPRLSNGRHDRRNFNGGTGPNMGHMNPNRIGGQRVQIPVDQMNGLCRDYHVKGFCSRGAFCKFSHSDDAVVPSPMMMPGGPGMPFMPTFNGAPGVGGAYDPHEARMDMQGGPGPYNHRHRAPIMPRGGDESMRGELPVIQDLTPQQDSEMGSEGMGGENTQQRPGRMHEYVPPRENGPRRGAGPMGPMGVGMANMGMPMGMFGMGMSMDVDMRNGMPMMGMPPQGMMPSGPAGGRGGFQGVPKGPRHGMRGTFNTSLTSNFDNDMAVDATATGGSGPARPERRQDKTLVVEKIPSEKLSIEAVTSWFKRFGTVTNVAVDTAGGKALVAFEDHAAAREAWRSEDAVFGNRFVKVFWHRPMTGHGTKGTALLAASASLVNKLATTEGGDASSSKDFSSGASSALKQKQQLLEQHLTEQKALMARLSSASAEEKKEILAQLRKLGEEIKKATDGAPTPTVSKRPASGKPPAVGSVDDEETRKKAELDRELDVHAAASAEDESGDNTAALRAQLAKLKAEAASLGIPESGSVAQQPAYSGYRGGFRARARGRGYFRGAPSARGGARHNMSLKLDNRPKKLLVKGFPPDSSQAVRDWYETTGGVASIESSGEGEVVVSFNTRTAAEQGLAKGANIPTIGQVQVSWHTSPAPPKTNGATKDASESIGDAAHGDMDGDDLLTTTGWGADDEDGMGLM